jgi:hypothetical protein
LIMSTARTKRPIEQSDDPQDDAALNNTVADRPDEQPIDPADGHTDRDELTIEPETEAARDRRVYLDTMADMAATIKALQAENWRITAAAAAAAERDKPVEEWLGCKAAAFDVGEPYQNVLAMCNAGIIVCDKPAGRWICEMNSLRAQIAKQRPGGLTKTARQVAADMFKKRRVRAP